MTALFEVNDVDRRFYEERLRDFLPPRIFDAHVHIWQERFQAKQSRAPVRAVTWPNRVACDQSLEDLNETYRLLLPGQQVVPLTFGHVLDPDDDDEGGNAYVSACAARNRSPALLFARPQWSAAEFERRIRQGGFVGAKVYLTLADTRIPEKEIRIYDFLPVHQLEVLDQHGWLVMVHVPRDGRIRDPLNLAQLAEIATRYPRVRVIIAHAGRAYCPEDVGDAYRILAAHERLVFDISANTSGVNFEQLLRAVGPRRILFGSDLPIVRMRMRRVCEHGNYVNIVPRGLYGDLTGDPHMREVEGPAAAALTFFLYEELDAFRQAATVVGLGRADLDDVFWNNAQRLLAGVGSR